MARPSSRWLRPHIRSFALGVAVAAVPMTLVRGYTVDDALIIGRVAHHLARGLGYRFNATGPVTDAVTPLGFPYLLAPFASAGPEAALLAAKWLGATAWAAAAGWLSVQISGSGARALCTLLPLAVSLPLAAWCVSGMETGVVTALATLALARGPAGDAAAMSAAALRPELVPYCAALRFGLAIARGAPVPRASLVGGLPLVAAASVAAIRWAVFGRAAPLSVFAKPSDLSHGVSYAVHAFVQTGLPVLLCTPALRRAGTGVARAIAVAVACHWASMALAGGDWMALYRLAVPVLPAISLAAAELSPHATRPSTVLRVTAATALGVWLFCALGPATAGVGPHRARLIQAARPILAGARSIASLDVGWVGAASDATVVDLAGVTDETFAFLPGGHTSKRVTEGLLASRRVDTLVLLTAPVGDAARAREESRTAPARAVEARVAAMPMFQEMRAVAALPLGGTAQSYVIYRRAP